MSAIEPRAASLRGASSPQRPLPSGAWDCHTHVFGPFDRYPVSPESRYQPPLAPCDVHREVQRQAGFVHCVIVHASANGFDNSGIIDAVAAAPGQRLAVAVVPEDISDRELAKMHQAGVRGLRFTDTGETVGDASAPGALGLRALQRMMPRLKAIGWHAQIWARCRHVVAARDWLLGGGVPVILDHMGTFDVSQGIHDASFTALLDMLGSGSLWVKLTTTRVTRLRWSDASDIRPFHDALIERAPDRMVWGSDWPYIAMDKDLPSIGVQIDLFDAWVNDNALRQRIFVTNPASLYATSDGRV